MKIQHVHAYKPGCTKSLVVVEMKKMWLCEAWRGGEPKRGEEEDGLRDGKEIGMDEKQVYTSCRVWKCEL